MPRKSLVIGCRGNHEARKGEHADVNKVSVFCFPKDECRKVQWLHRIPHFTQVCIVLPLFFNSCPDTRRPSVVSLHCLLADTECGAGR